MWRLHWRRAIFYSAITKRQHVSYIGKTWLESLRNVSLPVYTCARFTHASACTLRLCPLSSTCTCHALHTITARALSPFQRVHARTLVEKTPCIWIHVYPEDGDDECLGLRASFSVVQPFIQDVYMQRHFSPRIRPVFFNVAPALSGRDVDSFFPSFTASSGFRDFSIYVRI